MDTSFVSVVGPEILDQPTGPNLSAVLKKGSKTFSSAAWIFGPHRLSDVTILYAWCRAIDDATDGLPPAQAAQQLKQYRAWTLLALERGPAQVPEIFRIYADLIIKNQIPRSVVEDFFKGMESDLDHRPLTTECELELYCYRVAGTVGVFMTHLMGARTPSAIRAASQMGIAMQMTNIARDVLEDWSRNRIYLPSNWLSSEGANLPDDLVPQPQPRLYQVVYRMVNDAESRYETGLAGTLELPARAALAVTLAAHLYRGIGRKILRLGPKALAQRTILNSFERTFYAATALWDFLAIRIFKSKILPVPSPNAATTLGEPL